MYTVTPKKEGKSERVKPYTIKRSTRFGPTCVTRPKRVFFLQLPLAEERQAVRLAGLRRPHLAAAGQGHARHYVAQGRGHR